MSDIRSDEKKFSFTKVERKKAGKVLYIIGMILLFIAVLLLFSLNWMFVKFGHVSIDSTLYTLTAPKTGTDTTYIWTFLYMSLLPTVIIELVVWIITNNFYKKNVVMKIRTDKDKLSIRLFPFMPLRRILFGLSIIALVCSGVYVSYASGLTAYIKNKTTSTALYDDYYVNPATANITFPEKKRNVIYLYAESLEKTLESKEEGGAKSTNILPKLTELQKKYIAVANEKGEQGHVVKGGDWTMAGMVSQSSATPLMININFYNYNENAKFLPGAFSLGQILASNGYKNIFVTGCDSKFAATDLYYNQHGNYEIVDPDAAKKKGYIPEDYDVFWGYEDLKMFEILKKEITANYESGQPFNITAATLDTHADDVYECSNCDNQYTDVHDKVYHCADDQIAEFIEWFEKQPCYEDTTLIISGDHCSFATTYFDDCTNYNRTVFSMFVNAQVEKKDYVKTFTTLDMLPSTLAAMGVQIEGDRLGLGTNIFSDRQTLAEELGLGELNEMLSQNSEYYTNNILQGSDKDILNVSIMVDDAIDIDSADQMYETYYVNPDDVKLTFPEKKRNVLYLYVESLEKTLETKEDNGVETKEIMPYLTKLQKNNVTVQNENGGQAYVCYGGEYTIKGMVSQSSGVPLNDEVNAYGYSSDYKFIPGTKTIGDILEKNGYKNIFISGFDAAFAATDKFYTQHGNYDIIDYKAAKERGYISQDYAAGWGYNDAVTFEIIKDQITKAYDSGQPFNITAATLDTHADDVYVCDKCSDKFTDEHEKVYNCIDNQIKEFMEWFEKQPAYNDTTIVITGDHLSYASEFFTKFDENYDRTVYSVFINAQTDKDTKYLRNFSTLDMFPTTLAAMGVEIEGDRLGLGANLFSQAQPLTSKFGHHIFNTFLAEDCKFYNNVIMQRDKYTGEIDDLGIYYIEEQTSLPQTRVYNHNAEEAPTVQPTTQAVQQTTQEYVTQQHIEETTVEETTVEQTTESTTQEITTESTTQATVEVTTPVLTQPVEPAATQPSTTGNVVIPDNTQNNNGNVAIPNGNNNGNNNGVVSIP